MNKKHFVFDIDGTLIDSIIADLTSLQKLVLVLTGKKFELDDLNFAFGIPGEVALKQLGIEDAASRNKMWGSYFKQFSHTVTVFKGIEHLLRELQVQNCELGVITSRTRKEYADDFLRFQLTDYFSTVICFEDSVRPKPTADPMLEYIKRTGAKKEDVIYIGDSIYDFQCANIAGVDFGLAVWGCTSMENIHANYFFKTPDCVLKALSSNSYPKF